MEQRFYIDGAGNYELEGLYGGAYMEELLQNGGVLTDEAGVPLSRDRAESSSRANGLQNSQDPIELAMTVRRMMDGGFSFLEALGTPEVREAREAYERTLQ